MTIQRMDHVGITVGDLAAAIEFFLALGMERDGEGAVSGAAVDGIVGLEGVRSRIAFVRTPDGSSRIELCSFDAPPHEPGDPGALVNTNGLRHLCFAVDDLDAVLERLRPHGAELVGTVERYDPYRLCYVRGPEGVIVELAERVG